MLRESARKRTRENASSQKRRPLKTSRRNAGRFNVFNSVLFHKTGCIRMNYSECTAVASRPHWSGTAECALNLIIARIYELDGLIRMYKHLNVWWTYYVHNLSAAISARVFYVFEYKFIIKKIKIWLKVVALFDWKWKSIHL